MSSDDERVSNRGAAEASDDDDVPVNRAKKTVAAVFDSDSEDDEPVRGRARSPTAEKSDAEEDRGSDEDAAPRKRVLKRKTASDDEEEDGVNKDIFGSDSEAESPREKKKAKRGRSESITDEDEEEENERSRSPPRKRARDVFGSSDEEDALDAGDGERSDREDYADVFGSDVESDREVTGEPAESEEGKRGKSKGKGKKKSKQRDDEDEGPPADNKPKSYIKQQMEEEKAKKMAKKQQQDEQAVEAWVQKVINDMKVAAELDREANLNRKPGINKLKMLPLVEEELRIKGEKRGRRSDAEILDRQELYIENGVLTMIAQWLEPLPDKSLPSVQIRTALLLALDDLPVDRHRDELKESMVGQRIMLLSKHPKEVFENKQRCQNLITKWSRQVCGLSTDYRALSREERREISKREQELLEERRRRALARGLNDKARRRSSSDAPVAATDLGEALESGQRGPKPGEAGWRRHASIPQKTGRDYFVSPVGDAAPETAPKKKGPSRLDHLQRKAKELKSKSKLNPLSKMSVEGRGL